MLSGRTNAFAALLSVAAAQVCICETFFTVTNHCGSHLLACKSRLGKPVPVRPDASEKLSNGKPPASTGLEEASTTRLRPVVLCRKCGSTSQTWPFASSYYATACPVPLTVRGTVGPCRYAAATPRRVRETASTKLVRISTLARCTLLGLYVRDRLVD